MNGYGMEDLGPDDIEKLLHSEETSYNHHKDIVAMDYQN
jgi:hypothetical protein